MPALSGAAAQDDPLQAGWRVNETLMVIAIAPVIAAIAIPLFSFSLDGRTIPATGS